MNDMFKKVNGKLIQQKTEKGCFSFTNILDISKGKVNWLVSQWT